MAGHFYVSYSSVDGADFAVRLADALQSGTPAFDVWLDRRDIRSGRSDWDEQVTEAIQACEGLLFVMTNDSVRPESGSKPEWIYALSYKKPVIPVRVDPDVELPFRLGSRQFVDFSADFERGLAELRDNLRWLRTPEGQLSELEVRLAEAERELQRADPKLRTRIEGELADLGEQIERHRRLVANPRAVFEQTEARIAAAIDRERQPERPLEAAPRAKFVNAPPMTAPTYFQGRDVETGLIGEFLRADGFRLMWVVGRGGVGKTTMVCRLLKALEVGRPPDDLGELAVDGIVYLSSFGPHPVDFSHLFSDLCRLLPEDVAALLLERYRDPQETPAALMRALLEAFPTGRWVLMVDSFEDVVDSDGIGLTETALEEALATALRAPNHGLKILITSRVTPRSLLLVQPSVQRRLNLDEGLPSPHAEDVLRSMDPEGSLGLRDAPEELLARARERTRGFPRALEALAAILAADRDTTLSELLADAERMPENVVEALIGEAFNRIDPRAQQVMHALAIYPGPVPPVAVDYLLQPYVPAIDSTPVLARLVNMQFVRRDAGRYYLHQVDRAYALERIPVGEPRDRFAEPLPFSHFALRERAADYFQQTRSPRDGWRTLDDLAPQLAEFELRFQLGDYVSAASVLLEVSHEYLQRWGHVRFARDLHEGLQGYLEDDASTNAANLIELGSCYFELGDPARGIEFYEAARAVVRKIGDRQGEALIQANIGVGYAMLGDTRRALGLYEEALVISREIGDRQGEAAALGHLGAGYAELSDNRRAIDHYEQALVISHEIRDLAGEGALLGNLGRAYAALGETERAIKLDERALAIAREIGHRRAEAGNLGNLGRAYAALGETERAIELHEQALVIAREIGDRSGEGAVLGNLGRAYAALGETERAIEFHEQALYVAREIGHRRAEAENLRDLASCRATLDQVSPAIDRYEAAIAIDRELGDSRAEAVDLGSLADVWLRLGNSEQAERYYLEALTIAERLAKEDPSDTQAQRHLATATDNVRKIRLEVLERDRVAIQERLRAESERNTREPLLLRSLEFSSVDFFVDTTWEARPGVNVILGRNGFGKSFMLRALAGMLQHDERVTDVLFTESGPEDELAIRLTRGDSEELVVKRSPPRWRGDTVGKVPLLAIPDSRFTDRRVSIVPEPETLDLANSGAQHVIEQLPYQAVVSTLLWGLCIDYWEHGKTFELPSFKLLRRVIRELTDETFDFDSIVRPPGQTAFEFYVRTEGLSRPLLIQQASQGTLSVLTMFAVIQRFLEAIATAAGSNSPEDVLRQRAIVLIDEVDAHLHPVWQQKIRGLLTEVFPNVQFILTAHSPLVVAGCAPYEVSVMRRTGGRFVIEQLKTDFVGASAEAIYREVFDVEDLDEVFLRYSTEEARGGIEDVEKRIAALSEKEQREELSLSESEELDTLLLDLRRLKRVADVDRDRKTGEQLAVTLESVESENARLKHRLAELEAERIGSSQACQPGGEPAR
jgi:tetratricopeptide (TPR) repeat protein